MELLNIPVEQGEIDTFTKLVGIALRSIITIRGVQQHNKRTHNARKIEQ